MAADFDSTDVALDVRVLGSLAVVRAGQTIRLGGVRQRAVLARLICDVGRSVTTDQLADSMGAPELALSEEEINEISKAADWEKSRTDREA